MTVHYKTRGIVFKKSDRGEADRIFTIFTDGFGRIEVRGKALRKINSKLRAGIDNFYISEIEFIQGKNFKTLTDAIALQKPKLNFAKLEFLNKISELLDNFIKGEQRDDKIFCLLTEVLENSLKIENCKLKILHDYFFWNFFSALGYMPEVNNCAKCEDKLIPYYLYFSNKEGGILCKKCFNSDSKAQKLSSDAVKILRLILKKDWRTVIRLKTELLSENLLKQVSDSYCLYMRETL